MPVMAERSTVDFTARPWARVSAESDDERFDTLLDVLIEDPRAHGVGALATEGGEVSTIFQVEAPAYPKPTIVAATAIATDVFDRALAIAGFVEQTVAVAVVEGDDADQLP